MRKNRPSAGSFQAQRAYRPVVAAVALVVAGIVVGFLLSRVVAPGPTGIVVTRELAGTVSLVNNDKSHVCMIVAGAADAVCSGLWLTDGATLPAVGSRIAVWVVRVPTARGAEDMFILKPQDSGGVPVD